MDRDALEQSARNDPEPRAEYDEVARCLWLARADRWDEAHELCQDLPEPAGAWIHAWLHRHEGDYGNACYWYARAGTVAVARDAPLVEEWREIAHVLLAGK